MSNIPSSVHSIKSLNAFRVNDTIVIACYPYNMDIFLVFCCDFIPVAYQTPEMKTRHILHVKYEIRDLYASSRPIRLLIFFELTITSII